MDVIIIAAAIVIGLLQIILFFKIWGMADDVGYIKKIVKGYLLSPPQKEEAQEENNILESQAAFLQGDLKTAKSFLDREFYLSLAKLSRLTYSYEDEYDNLVNRLKPYYEVMEIESPDFSKFIEKQ